MITRKTYNLPRLSTALFAIGLAAGISSCASTKTMENSAVKNTPAANQLVRSDFSPGEITQLCKQAEDTAAGLFDQIATTPVAQRNIDNTLLTFENTLANLGDTSSPLTFMSYVSTDARLREEGAACEERIGKFAVTIFTRKDLYQAIKDPKVKGRNTAESRLLEKTIEKFERNGLKLPDDKLALVKEKMQRLAALESQFSANLNNDTSTVEFTEEELAGLPESFLKRLKKTADGKKYIVTTKTTDYREVTENAKTSETRRRITVAYFNRAGEKNTPLLEEAIKLREETARLLGYKTWADYRTEDRMAKNGTEVRSFLDNLKEKLSQRNKKDLAELLRFKKKLDPSAKDLQVWDVNYLAYQLKKTEYDLDDEKIREYFPAETVVQGMFNVYSQLLGVKFVEDKDMKVWSPDVKTYKIVDAATKAGQENVLAYFYADFYPRNGKYGHAAAFNLLSGRMNGDSYSKPVSAIVSNFTPAGAGKPPLLNHDEVETLFHEFGHIMHQTLTKAPYASLSGSDVARDFVEAPSQMLEEWVWSPKILKLISGHYQNPAKKLPDTLIKQMIKARDFNRGYFYTRQLYLGLLDMTYHTTSGPVNPDRIHDDLYREIIGIEPVPGAHFPAGFGHLMGGYDAGYYGYLWSEVYAADMSTRFEKGGMLNSKIGLEYRRAILEKGNMEDAQDLLVQFLKRKPDNKTFLKKLKIH